MNSFSPHRHHRVLNIVNKQNALIDEKMIRMPENMNASSKISVLLDPSSFNLNGFIFFNFVCKINSKSIIMGMNRMIICVFGINSRKWALQPRL